ncbi:hypothetical protein IKG24_00375 [Candidatus Saccharibacteria bacterium]|nr:hypothetical protein [Candidatus Saccharibacteria bacterium]
MLNIFSKKKTATPTESTAPVASATMPTVAPAMSPSQTSFAEIALNSIHDGVVMTNASGVIQFINPAAAVMTDCKDPSNAIGLDYGLLIKIETKEGRELTPEENPLIRAMQSGQALEGYSCALISGASMKRIPISITVIPINAGSRIITFRNIEKELAEESEHNEFISTASHEMRTPVATIDGYLALCLNPQTATIDDRAKGYLESAKKASEHLGHLFQNLLDVTKLDDGRIRPKFVPAEMIGLIKQIVADHASKAAEKKINFTFGAKTSEPVGEHRLEQVVYASVDLNFMREIMDNLLDNAIKYTPSGGSVFVNVVGDNDRVLINVTDTGIGISSEDLQHIFQKFYRADNSDTREIGGTGLGLYIVKQRTEAMGGHVTAESTYGEGTTFYVSLPRITAEEYQKRLIAVQNASMINNNEGGK